ncbi:MAG: DNA-binding protein [Planctomycetota bacterium]|nr:MAG: DNA-binding protein [Planctomycetota bacterium]
MKFTRFDNTFVVRLEQGEDIVPALNAFCAEQAVTGAVLHGIGAVKEATLGYYSLEKEEYVRRDFRGEFEIVNLAGNVTVLEGKPFVHAHVALAGRDEQRPADDFKAVGGHLFRGIISATAEIIITSIGAAIRRTKLPGATLALIDLPQHRNG